MTITLPTELEAALVEQAHRQQTTPEAVALNTLQASLLTPGARPVPSPRSHEEWVALIRSLGRDCGVSPPDEALSSEALYD